MTIFYIFDRSGFQITRRSIQQDGNENLKVFVETGENEPTAEEIVKESESFLLEEKSKHVTFSSPLRDTSTFETDLQSQEKISSALEASEGMY